MHRHRRQTRLNRPNDGVVHGQHTTVDVSMGDSACDIDKCAMRHWLRGVAPDLSQRLLAERSKLALKRDPNQTVATSSAMRPAASANATRRCIMASKALRVRLCSPSERADSGSGCTSTISPSAPAATAAYASGATSDARPPAWLGSTMTG